MKILSQDHFNNNCFLALQDLEYLENLRVAGKIATQTLNLLEDLVKNKTSKSLLELDSIIEENILSNNAIPTFKGYNNFPNSCCFSVNKQLVHGIATDYKLQDGDLITFDLGVTYNHAIADTAVTFIFGNPLCEEHVRLLNTTNKALQAGINAIKVGARIGNIGNSIYKTATASGFGVVTNYGGHTITRDNNGIEVLHGPPFISNKDNSNNGLRIQPGMVLCIEPMLTIGDPKTKVEPDKWTVSTNGINAHFEHTVFVHANEVEIITKR